MSLFGEAPDLKILSGTNHPRFVAQVCRYLGLSPAKALVDRFADGEIRVELLDNVRGQDAFIVQSISRPCNDHLMEVLLLADSLRRASARRITAVIPYFAYSRQDRRPRSARVPISSRLVADMLCAAGVNRVLMMDVHVEQIQGFFNVPVDNIYATPLLLADIFQRNYDASPLIVSPDIGGVVRARSMAKCLNTDLAIIDKRRPAPNQTEVVNIIGDPADRVCIMVDDIVDTANTLCRSAEALKKQGAKRVLSYCTHPVLSQNAVEVIAQSALDELVVTDTIPLKSDALACSKIRQLSIAHLLAETISRISHEESLSTLFSNF